MGIEQLYQIIEKKEDQTFLQQIDKLKRTSQQLINKVDMLKGEAREDELADLLNEAGSIYRQALDLTWSSSPNADVLEAGEGEEGLCSITGNVSEGYILSIPFPPKKNKSTNRTSSKLIGAAIKTAARKYLSKEGINTPVYEKAIVKFRLFLNSDLAMSEYPDADNIDLKYILDSLGGLLIRNDNILAITYIVEGDTTESESYCEIYVNKMT